MNKAAERDIFQPDQVTELTLFNIQVQHASLLHALSWV